MEQVNWVEIPNLHVAFRDDSMVVLDLDNNFIVCNDKEET